MHQKISNKPFSIFLLIIVMNIILLFSSAHGQDENIVIDQSMISTAILKDPELINFFLDAYLIPEEAVVEMRFIDATGNGFGEEDLIKCLPSEKTYFLFPSEEAQAVMNNWKFTSNFQSVTQNAAPETFENLETDKAQNAVLASLLSGLNRNYSDVPMKIYFERDSNAVVFDMWGYKADSLNWKAKPKPPKVPDTTYDILHVLRSDTLILSDTTYYDQFYIYRSVADTLYMSEKEFNEKTRQQQTIYQPGLVPAGKE